MSPPVVVLYDIDGTLLDTDGAGGAAFVQAFAETWDIAETDLPPLTLAGATDLGLWATLVEEVESASDQSEQRDRFFDLYLRFLAENFQATEYSPSLYEGAAELVDLLHDDPRFRLGLLTGNLKRGAEFKVGHFGLESYFPFGAFGDDDSDRDVLAQLAVERARSQPEVDMNSPIWVLGDTPKDIRCARAANVFAAAVATGSSSMDDLEKCEPDLLFQDLSEPTKVLEAFLSPPES